MTGGLFVPALLAWLAVSWPVDAQTAAAPAVIRFEDATSRFVPGEVPPARANLHFTGLPDTLGSGVVVADFDRDGLYDIFLVGAAPAMAALDATLPRRGRLLRQMPGGTFVDATRSSGLVSTPGTFGAAAADYDGDGDLDLFLTGLDGSRLFRNEQSGRFRDVTSQAGVGQVTWGTSPVFFDADGDGWLDLFVPSYIEFDPAYRIYFKPDGFPSSSAYMPTVSKFYHNNGNGTFADRTAAVGLGHPMRALSALATDLDRDGKPDLYVACDGMESQVFLNRGDGRFRRLGAETGLWYGEKGEGTGFHGAALWNDGWSEGRPGLFVTDETLGALFQHVGTGKYDDRTVSADVAEVLGQAPSWGSIVADLDADGFEDLFVARGAFRHAQAAEDRILRGSASGRFTDATDDAGPALREKAISRACAAADLDGDGLLDVVEAAVDRPLRILRNVSTGGRSLRLRLAGKRGNPQGVGARITVRAAGRTWRRELTSGAYFGWAAADVHIGVGQAAALDSVEVQWPSGKTQSVVVEGIPAKPLVVSEP